MQYGRPESPQRTLFSYSYNDTADTAWQQCHWYSILRIADMGTVDKYIHVPKNAKFTQEKQNGNRLRREIPP